MAIPQSQYMKLKGGENSSSSTIYTSSLINVGDTIKISGTASNNGVFTVSSIVLNSTGGSDDDVYYVLKGKTLQDESSAGSTDPQIEVIKTTGDKLCALSNTTNGTNIGVWSNHATTDYTSRGNGWTADEINPTVSGLGQKIIYFFVDEAIRACNINEDNESMVKWYGYIQRDQFGNANDNSVSPKFAEWQEHPNTLSPPRMTGQFTFAYGTTNFTGSTAANYYNTNYRGVAKPKRAGDDSDFSGTVNNLQLNAAHNDSVTAFTFENDNATANALDQSVVGEVISISDSFTDNTHGSDITSGTNITMDGANTNILAGMSVSGTGIGVGATVVSVTSSTIFVVSSRTGTVTAGSTLTFRQELGHVPKEYLFCKKISGSTGSTITYSRAYGGALIGTAPDSHSDQDTPILDRGLGWNIAVSDGTDDGQWLPDKYEFYQTFIYDGNQESLPAKMGNGASTIAAFTHTAVGGKSLRVAVYTDMAYNGRVSGGRIYIRRSESDDELILLLDIDIVQGVRSSLTGDFSTWTYQAGKGFYVIPDAVGNCKLPNIDTYTTINGFSNQTKFISIGKMNELYKDVVVANRRAFIVNVKTAGYTGELERYGDRLMYSEINKFDTFLEDNFIDVSKGDYGEYVAIKTFADRLIAYKHNLVHIINIASPNPSNWYLEDTLRYGGINFKYSVTNTKYGVAWVSETGCYLYDGSRVTNLIDKKLGVNTVTNSLSQSTIVFTWADFITGLGVGDVMVGYEPMSDSLIIQRSPTDSTTNSDNAFIFDFNTGGWTHMNTLLTDSRHISNFFHDWNNNLCLFETTTINQTDPLKFLPVPLATADQNIYTRDIDFGDPSTTKKVYAVTITYKSSASQANPLQYAKNGKQDFGTFASKTLAATSDYDMATFTASTPISCGSIQFLISLPSSGTFEINEMSIEYRTIRGTTVADG